MSVFDIIALFFALAGIFLYINTYLLKLPSSIGLMILALLLSFVVLIIGTIHPEYHLAEHVAEFDYTEFMYRFVLSVMLFAGALNVNFYQLDRQLIPVLVLSTLGVIISTATIGVLVYYMAQLIEVELSFTTSLVFGALISGTDPIAIVKNIKRYSLSSALESKVRGESLLNGGISIVIAFTLANIHEAELSPEYQGAMDAFTIVIKDLAGGLLVGLVFGWLGYQLLKFVDNEHVEAEMLITLAMVMGGSYLADALGVSSTLVAVLSGIIIGNMGRDQYTGESAVGNYVYKFWGLLEETIAAILFVLIGFEMLVIPIRLDYFAGGFFAVLITLFGRWLGMFIPIKLMGQDNFDKATISVLTWGALRGGLPVAFTLSLHEFPGKDILITFTYVVVGCTLLYQGLTLNVVMKYYQSKNAR